MSTATANVSNVKVNLNVSAKQEIETAWQNVRTKGLEFGRVCYEWLERLGGKSVGGRQSSGDGLAGILAQLNIPRHIADYWMHEYEFANGLGAVPCLHCDERFPSKSKLRKHVHKKHPEAVAPRTDVSVPVHVANVKPEVPQNPFRPPAAEPEATATVTQDEDTPLTDAEHVDERLENAIYLITSFFYSTNHMRETALRTGREPNLTQEGHNKVIRLLKATLGEDYNRDDLEGAVNEIEETIATNIRMEMEKKEKKKIQSGAQSEPVQLRDGLQVRLAPNELHEDNAVYEVVSAPDAGCLEPNRKFAGAEHRCKLFLNKVEDADNAPAKETTSAVTNDLVDTSTTRVVEALGILARARRYLDERQDWDCGDTKAVTEIDELARKRFLKYLQVESFLGVKRTTAEEASIPVAAQAEVIRVPSPDNIGLSEHANVPYATLEDLSILLDAIADDLGCGHGLPEFADRVTALMEDIDRLVELRRRVNGRDWAEGQDSMVIKDLTRDRRNQKEMKRILNEGGTHYLGRKIMGSKSDPYIQRWTRAEVSAELGIASPENLIGA
jgi:hypothetical protein